MKTVEDLKSVQAKSILRLNCPGYGGSSLLTIGQARPLTEYKVIIVNPISIVHIFENNEPLIKQIDGSLAEGMTSCKLSDGGLVERISQQIEARSPELFQFLAEGGLLIYFLCRPFVVTNENRSMDNYAWLCGLAPDQSGESTISEQAVRHMSTVAHGRNVDKCDAASESEFEKYLEQVGLEWNTIIRTDFLTSGYSPLAQAGPKKCIAGELIAGDNGGRVLFLPAPYSPDFDRVLVECINLWSSVKNKGETNGETNGGAVGSKDNHDDHSANDTDGEIQIPTALNQKPAHQSFKDDFEHKPAFKDEFEHKKPQAPAHPEKGNLDIGNKARPAQPPNPSFPAASAPSSFPSPPAARSTFSAQSLPPVRPAPSASSTSIPAMRPKPSVSSSFSSIPAANIQRGHDQDKYRQEPVEQSKRFKDTIAQETSIADWCNSYWLPGMDNLFKDTQALHKQITELEKKLATNEDIVTSLEGVKATLLSGRPGDLLECCKVVLDDIGFATEVNGNNELVLADNEQHLAVVRVALSNGSPERSELARLTESLISFWDSHGVEPKGVLLACTYSDVPITQRKEADFSNLMLDFASKKNICLVSTTQLISIYLEYKLGKLNAPKVRRDIFTTAGALPGFVL